MDTPFRTTSAPPAEQAQFNYQQLAWRNQTQMQMNNNAAAAAAAAAGGGGPQQQQGMQGGPIPGGPGPGGGQMGPVPGPGPGPGMAAKGAGGTGAPHQGQGQQQQQPPGAQQQVLLYVRHVKVIDAGRLLWYALSVYAVEVSRRKACTVPLNGGLRRWCPGSAGALEVFVESVRAQMRI